MGMTISGLNAWEINYSPSKKQYIFTLKDGYSYSPDAGMHIVIRLEGSDPLIVINQNDNPKNPALRGDAMKEFLGFSDFIQKHQRELDEIPF